MQLSHSGTVDNMWSTLRVSAPDDEIKVDPALVEYLYRFSLVLAS